MMGRRVLIYGSTGYTGRLLVEQAIEQGLGIVLAGRSTTKVKEQASSLGLPWRSASLEHDARLADIVSEVSLVINAAGPFAVTTAPMLNACLRAGTHYLDLSGELSTFEIAYQADKKALRKKIMVMPGAGFGIVATECLASYVCARLPLANYLRLGLSQSNRLSRGSVRTVFTFPRDTVTIRRNGKLVAIPFGHLEHRFDFGYGLRSSIAVTWPDVFTSYYSLGIPNTEVYIKFEPIAQGFYQLGRLVPGLGLLGGSVLGEIASALVPDGPSRLQRRLMRSVVVAEAEDNWRRKSLARLETIDGYSFSAAIAIRIAKRILAGEMRCGFQTPVAVFGNDLVFDVAGTYRQDLVEWN
jgi:short subunit dehydrogenase-like uncharacterized protein